MSNYVVDTKIPRVITQSLARQIYFTLSPAFRRAVNKWYDGPASDLLKKENARVLHRFVVRQLREDQRSFDFWFSYGGTSSS